MTLLFNGLLALFSVDYTDIMSVGCVPDAVKGASAAINDTEEAASEFADRVSMGSDMETARPLLTLRCADGEVEKRTGSMSGSGSEIEFIFDAEMLDHMTHIVNEIKRRAEKAREPANAIETPVQIQRPMTEDPFSQLKKLAELRDMGVISNDEFEEKKKSLLSRI